MRSSAAGKALRGLRLRYGKRRKQPPGAAAAIIGPRGEAAAHALSRRRQFVTSRGSRRVLAIVIIAAIWLPALRFEAAGAPWLIAINAALTAVTAAIVLRAAPKREEGRIDHD